MPQDGHIHDDTSSAIDRPSSEPLAASAWIDLRTAEHHTGIPMSTLRRWHRRGAILSRIIDTPEGPKVELDADAVAARAAERGLNVDLRSAEPYAPPIPAPEPPPANESAPPERATSEGEGADGGTAEVDRSDPGSSGHTAPLETREQDAPQEDTPQEDTPQEEFMSEARSGTTPAATSAPAWSDPAVAAPSSPDLIPEPDPAPDPESSPERAPQPEPAAPPAREPDDAIIVPLDSWRRMLIQLGNLHETGQQLADAKERAARAETEASFLKERLADLRNELEVAKAAAIPPDPPSTPADPQDEAAMNAMPSEAISASDATADVGAGEGAARTSAGRAVDQVVELAVRKWKQRRGE